MKEMKSVMAVVGAIILVVLGSGAWFFMGGGFGGEGGGESGLMVASFNGEIFGDAKIRNVGVDYYVDLISDYDLFFLLEIRDADGSSFDELCSALVGYECLISERSGRSVSKEAVGVFYKSELGSFGLNEYVGDAIPLFERVPFYVDVNGVRFWVVHLNPDDVYREMEALEVLVSDVRVQIPGGTVVIGDMNADCDYYSSGVDFDGWNWVIGDEADTTSGFSDCAYDRVITRGVEVLGSGVREIDARVSDHNLVWVEIR